MRAIRKIVKPAVRHLQAIWRWSASRWCHHFHRSLKI